jgi:hypothetical protein
MINSSNFKDPWIKANVFISLMKLKNRESKILTKTWSKNIKNNRRTVEGNAQIGTGLCFHKNQNWKERKKETILFKSPNFHSLLRIDRPFKEFRIIQDASIQLFSMFLYIYRG